MSDGMILGLIYAAAAVVVTAAVAFWWGDETEDGPLVACIAGAAWPVTLFLVALGLTLCTLLGFASWCTRLRSKFRSADHV